MQLNKIFVVPTVFNLFFFVLIFLVGVFFFLLFKSCYSSLFFSPFFLVASKVTGGWKETGLFGTGCK